MPKIRQMSPEIRVAQEALARRDEVQLRSAIILLLRGDKPQRREAISLITDNEVLEHIALNERVTDIALAAARKLTDPARIANVLRNRKATAITITMVHKTEDQELLLNTALYSSKHVLRIAATLALRDEDMLKKLISASDNKDVVEEAHHLLRSRHFIETSRQRKPATISHTQIQEQAGSIPHESGNPITRVAQNKARDAELLRHSPNAHGRRRRA